VVFKQADSAKDEVFRDNVRTWAFRRCNRNDKMDIETLKESDY
jgi:hypothetical protein